MINNEQTILQEKKASLAEQDSDSTIAATINLNQTLQQQILLPHKFFTHHPKAGINPLVDAAAYLFSIIGKLKQVTSYRNLAKLHQELLQELNAFQDTAKSHGYSSEYILVARYALCATLDDIILNTSWGSQGQWDSFNLLSTLNQESSQSDRFFIILDRISKDPILYIDVMELMYICLSLGYKGQFHSTEFNNNQLDHITNVLYKCIRAYRGEFSKTLSPFPIKTVSAQKKYSKKMPMWMILVTTIFIIVTLFLSLQFLLDTISNQAYQDLMNIGKSLLYENEPNAE